MAEQKKELKEIGVLWKRQGKNQIYISGVVDISPTHSISVLIFANRDKSSTSQPDYKMMQSGEPFEKKYRKKSDPKA